MKMLVTVIIPWSPVHTPKEMLKAAIDSVQQQSVKTKIILVKDKNQRGPAWARNTGLNQADSRYVAFLDADDVWKQKKLSQQITKMLETGAAVCVEGDSRPTEEFIRGIYVSEINSITSSILLDTDQVNCRFEEDLDRREDHLFVMEAAAAGGVCFCTDIVNIRKQKDGLTASTTSEIQIRNGMRFKELANQKIPTTKRYNLLFDRNLYFRHGRFKHSEGEFFDAIRSFSKSLRYGFRIKTVIALILSILGLMGIPTERV